MVCCCYGFVLVDLPCSCFALVWVCIRCCVAGICTVLDVVLVCLIFGLRCCSCYCCVWLPGDCGDSGLLIVDVV